MPPPLLVQEQSALLISEDCLHVARRARVLADPTMSSVNSAPHLGGFVAGCAQWPENLHLNPYVRIILCIFKHVR